MGVDIGFHIEVRKKNKWIPVVWKLHEEIADPYMEYKNVDGWVEIDAIISGRFYHFDDFLESSASRQGLPEDISERFKRTYDEEHEAWGIGYFSLADLNNYCQRAEYNVIIHMLEQRDGKLKQQLNRIEDLLRQKPVLEKSHDEDFDDMDYDYEDVHNTYQEFLNESFLIRKLRDEVCGITDDIRIDDSEIRILYFAC